MAWNVQLERMILDVLVVTLLSALVRNVLQRCRYPSDIPPFALSVFPRCDGQRGQSCSTCQCLKWSDQLLKKKRKKKKLTILVRVCCHYLIFLSCSCFLPFARSSQVEPRVEFWLRVLSEAFSKKITTRFSFIQFLLHCEQPNQQQKILKKRKKKKKKIF